MPTPNHTIRIANGSAFWGDSQEAPLQLLRGGPLDYLTLDYLAEITMSILQKQRARDPRAGFAHDFPGLIKRGAREIAGQGVKVVANAGGVNPEGCRTAVAAALQAAGFGGRIKVGVVTGDDIMPRLDELMARGVTFTNLDTGEALSGIRQQVQSANVYFGAFPIAEALQQGAGIVITGRCNDAALALGPMIHEFGWRPDDWDRLSAGVIAGHTIECGAQCTGGNCQAGWESTPDFAGIGYPIVEAAPDGTFVVTKHSGTGGRVSVAGVTEQLLYEIGDPRSYITPDCIADFTTIRLEQQGADRVRFSSIRGRPRPSFTKFRSATVPGTRLWAPWSIPGRTHIRRRKQPIASSGSGSRVWVSSSMRSIPNLLELTPVMVIWREAHLRRLPKWHCGWPFGARIRRWWNALPVNWCP
jgi:hypothetical protein